MNIWKISYSYNAIRYAIIVPIILSIIFPKYFIPIGLYTVGSFIIVSFFIAFPYYEKKWKGISIKSFEKKIFRVSFFLRLVFVIYLYSISYFLAPNSFPFEYGAADSWTYHIVALELKDYPLNQIFEKLPDLMKGRADFGFPTFLALIYKISGGTTFLVRIVNILLSTFTVILLSRLARFLFTEKHARLTGIIAMLFPSLIWFSAIQLKETLMIFMIVSVFYYVLKTYINKKITLKPIFFIIVFSLFLFYFRTFLAVLVIISFMLFLTLNNDNSKKATRNTVSVILISIGLVFVFNSTNLFSDVDAQLSEREGFMENNLSDAQDRLGNISYTNALVSPLIIVGAFITPFPSFLQTEERQFPIIFHYQNEMVKNLMYYFGLLGIIIAIRKNFKKTIMLSFFVLSYLFVLMTTANSFIDRFQLVNVPFVIIFMSVGLIDSDLKWKKRWNHYLVLLVVMHVSWTLFKLNIRGLI